MFFYVPDALFLFYLLYFDVNPTWNCFCLLLFKFTMHTEHVELWETEDCSAAVCQVQECSRARTSHALLLLVSNSLLVSTRQLEH